MRAASLAAVVLLAALNVAAQPTSDATLWNAPVAYVYVAEDTSPTQIAAFLVSGDGTPQNISGSPFAGVSKSQNAVVDAVVSSGFVWATDGLNIMTYTRNPKDGVLTLSSVINGIAHNDTPILGSQVGALTLDRSGSTLYAGEINFQGADNNAYAAFTIQPSGALTFLANSEISSFYGGPMQFSENNQFAYSNGCYFLNWVISGFQRASDGSLIGFSPGSQMPPSSNNFICPGAQAVSALGYLAQSYQFVGLPPPIARLIAIYKIVPGSGVLELVANSEAVSSGTNGITALRFDPAGRFLAVTGGNGIQSFRLNNDGTLTEVGTVQDASVSFSDVKWDKCRHVYALSSYDISNVNGSALYVYTQDRSGLLRRGGPVTVPSAQTLAVEPARQCGW